MKTFKHTINGKEYTLSIIGTVGLQIMAQAIVPNESERFTTVTAPGDSSTTTVPGNSSTTTVPGNLSSGKVEESTIPTAKWLMALLYSAFIASNPKAQDTVDFMQFMMSFSNKEFSEAVTWYYEAYAEREGLLPAPVPSDSLEGNDEGSKNA